MESHNDSDLTKTEWAKIDAACDRFESAWRSGHRPAIGDYLVTGTANAKLLRELILLDIEYREIHGEKAQRSDYQSQFHLNKKRSAKPLITRSLKPFWRFIKVLLTQPVGR